MKTFLIAASFVIYSAFFCLGATGQDKKATRYLNRSDYTILGEYLDKQLRRDSLNPNVYFTKSLMYSQSLYEGFNLDSAYSNILIACRQFQREDEKRIKRLLKSGITNTSIRNQKSKIEEMAFEHAKSVNTVEGYNYFIQNLPSALQQDEAIELRNTVAFENVSTVNTYQAYLEFIKTYPTATQAPEAQSRYDHLIYTDFTKDDRLESYERFAYSFPTSSHWEEAVGNIFGLSTVSNTPESYINFINKFPESRLTPVAAAYLYLTAKDISWIYNLESGELPFYDSIKLVIALDSLTILPVLENQLYGFMDLSGKMIIPIQYRNIDQAYLCGKIGSNFLVVWNDSTRIIVARDGNVIFNEPFYNFEDLGSGLLKLSRDARYGVIHLSGFRVLPFNYDEIGLVGEKFIKAKTRDNWNLFSLAGRQLTHEGYLDIEEEGQFIIFRQGEKIAITTSGKIVEMWNNNNFDLSFDFEDTELIGNDLILCAIGPQECLMNGKLEYVIPPGQQRIFSYREGWLAKNENKYDLYDGKFIKISGSGLTDISYKGMWITGKNKKKWILYYRFAPIPDEFLFDSVAILDPDYVIIMNGKRTELLLPGFRKISLDGYAQFELLPQAQTSPENLFTRYMALHKKNGQIDILNPSGKIIFSGKFEFLQSLGENYFIIRKKNKYGLLNAQGKILVKPEYDGIANYSHGYITTLNDEKFGLANPLKGIEIEPRYSSSPEPFNDSLFIFRNGPIIGIIDHAGKHVFEMTGNKIQYWNDTACLIMNGNIGKLVAVKTGRTLYDNITSCEKISTLSSETSYLIKAGDQDLYGILSDVRGQIINISFTDILNLGTFENPVYFAEKYITEADIYIVIYYGPDGSLIRKQVYSPEEYAKIYCR